MFVSLKRQTFCPLAGYRYNLTIILCKNNFPVLRASEYVSEVQPALMLKDDPSTESQSVNHKGTTLEDITEKNVAIKGQCSLLPSNSTAPHRPKSNTLILNSSG